MRLVGLILLVFMVSALGSWFGVRYAGEKVMVSASNESLEAEIAALRGRIEQLESPSIENSLPSAAEKVLSAASGSGKEEVEQPSSTESVERGSDSSSEAAEDSRWPDAKREWFEARASRDLVIFTDVDGRVVEAELVDVTPEAVRIIRREDQRQFQLPLERLIPSDREFIEFLVETGRYAPNAAPESDEVDWAAVFGEGSV